MENGEREGTEATLSSDSDRGHRMTLSRQFWMSLRQALLMIVHGLEEELSIEPRTSELRKWWKEQRRERGRDEGARS